MDDSKFLNELGARIKTLRVQKNLTQYELAVSCEFEAASMSRIESGKINITIITLKKISHALNIKLTELFNDGINA